MPCLSWAYGVVTDTLDDATSRGKESTCKGISAGIFAGKVSVQEYRIGFKLRSSMPLEIDSTKMCK